MVCTIVIREEGNGIILSQAPEKTLKGAHVKPKFIRNSRHYPFRDYCY